MKKRWRIAILATVALGLAMFAAAGWLGFLPFGRPDNEHDFMVEQLNRVRYAGPFRSDDEKAVADLLPEDPTIADLRVACYRRWFAENMALRQELVKSRPELRRVDQPPWDDTARAALDSMNKRSASIEQTTPLDAWMQGDDSGWGPERCAAFLTDSSDVPSKLAAATPASGQVLLKFRDDGEIDMPASFGATARVMSVRVRCLFATGDAGGGWRELMQLSAFCRDAHYGPALIGMMCYDLKNLIFLTKCVLPLARQGALSADQLDEVASHHRLTRPDVVQIARTEEFVALSRAYELEEEHWLVAAKSFTESAFESHGATSLGHWLEQDAANSKARHEGWNNRLDALVARKLDFRNPDQAGVLLNTDDRDKGDWVLDQAKILATAAASTAESEGLLLAVKLHAAKARDPAGWRDQTQKLAAEYPFARLEKAGTTIEVRPNLAHPALAYLKQSDRVYATVP